MHPVLEGIARNKRIASAYLFAGPPDSGKKESALEFAESLGSKNVDRVVLEPRGASFKIEQVREIQQLVRYGPSNSPYLCVVVERADEMTAEAAAAFLKTLEEPPPGVVFILLVEREDRIPETIISRCQKVIFGERYRPWSPDPELGPFYAELSNAARKGVLERLEFSARLEKEKERIEELLYEMVNYCRHELNDLRLVRVLLDAVKNLKRKANLRLTLDVACLKMGET